MSGAVIPDEAELRRRVGRLSLERKIRLLTGEDFWALYAEPEVGLRRLVLSDGPAGVRGQSWDERDSSGTGRRCTQAHVRTLRQWRRHHEEHERVPGAGAAGPFGRFRKIKT